MTNLEIVIKKVSFIRTSNSDLGRLFAYLNSFSDNLIKNIRVIRAFRNSIFFNDIYVSKQIIEMCYYNISNHCTSQ